MNVPTTEALAVLDRLGRARVLVVGDVMLDRFVYGTVDRISPEGPIGILRVRREMAVPGGAGNVVRNLAAWGVRATLVSVVGADAAGVELRQLLAREPALRVVMLRDRNRETTIKTRYIAGAQQLLRADRESGAGLDAKTRRTLIERAVAAIPHCAAMVLSDYGKGVLADGVAGELIVAAHRAGKPVLVDPKGSDYAAYARADLVTPNQRELAEASRSTGDSDEQVEHSARYLIAKHKFGAVLATRSSRGASLVPARGAVFHVRANAREVFDVAGAGDTAIAAVAAAMASGAPLEAAAVLGNAAASVVVGKVGTAIASVEELRAALTDSPGKVLPLAAALAAAARWRHAAMRVGFTNGCFDLLHPGHVALLRQARAACDRLIVGLNSDRSVRRLKGKGRPVQNEAARIAVLASLGDVDGVVVFDQDTPLALIEALRPDLLVKGADYTEDTVVGAAFVRSYGGQVLLAELKPEHSTTSIIGRMGAGRAAAGDRKSKISGKKARHRAKNDTKVKKAGRTRSPRG